MDSMEIFSKFRSKLGLGVGLDMPWGKKIGFDYSNTPSDRVYKYLTSVSDEISHFFFAFQPKSNTLLSLNTYQAAYTHLFEILPTNIPRAFHHTMLNIAGEKSYDRGRIYDFTNELVEKYGIKWINEDVGIWSIKNKPLPYPIAPILTSEGLKVCVENTNDINRNLAAPLLLEFPGFTDGSNFHVGRMNAFEFFRDLALDTNSPVTLDVAHIISYLYLTNTPKEQWVDSLSKLPLDHCFEIHMSGCEVVNGLFRDLHHGIILDEQIDILKVLLDLCRNVKAITYEDPKFDKFGAVIDKAKPNLNRLQQLVKEWMQ